MTDKQFQKKLAKIQKRGERYKQEKELRDKYADYVPEHKKRKVSNIMLVISVIAIVGYVVASYILQSTTGYELSPTITPYWFSFWIGETGILGLIKMTKTIKSHTNDESCG